MSAAPHKEITMGTYRFDVGDFVLYWFDTGGGKQGGFEPLYGVVRQAGPKTFTVEWESQRRNRLRQDSSLVKKLVDPEGVDEVRRVLMLFKVLPN